MYIASLINVFIVLNIILYIFIAEFDHPCTVNVEVFANDSEQSMTKFSLDLVSPMEYLFRSLSLDDQGKYVYIYVLFYVVALLIEK